jgi:hypothetical protein
MELFKRENYLKKIRGFYDSDDIIKVVTGVRRCGKSSLMESIANELLEKGVKKQNIVFIDLEEKQNRRIKTADQLEKEIEKHGKARGLKYLFIDEVQYIDGFEEVINGFRAEGGWSIFITGSNSYLLSGELMTKLTGRYLEFEMFPLSFEEYEGMKQFYGKHIDPNDLIELNNYILEGGFPRTVLIDDLPDKRTYVSGVIKEIIDKDIRKRIKIRDVDAFETVMQYIINNYGSTSSINSICDELKKNGISISRPTITRYINALLDAKVLYECKRFDVKSKRSLKGEKKYYLADLSLYFAQNVDNRINYGPVLENMVFIYSRSKAYSVSVGRVGKLECDFILRDMYMNYSYVQVAYTILASRETEDREYRVLEGIRDNYPKYVVTTDGLIQKRNGIKHVNLMSFMKNGELF